MRHHRYWLLLIAIVLGSLAQLAVEGGLNFMTGKINFILVALILLINLTDFSAVAIFGVLAGLILDIYSGLPFGLISVSLFLTLIILEVLFVNFFTNFSFYSLMLMGLIAVIAYNAAFISLAAAMYFVGWSDVGDGIKEQIKNRS
jgi:hypothetical protein